MLNSSLLSVLEIAPDSIFAERGWSGVIELFELILMSITVAFFFQVGVNFGRKFLQKERFEIQRRLSLGYCFFLISIGLGYGTYVIDRIWRFLTGGERIFAEANFSAINRDYILLTLWFVSLSLVFLSFVVEKYILSRKPVLTIICLIGFIYTLALRAIEGLLLGVAPDVVEYIGYASYLILFLVLVMLIYLYSKIAKSAPIRSDLWNRSVAFIIGLLLMLLLLMVGNNQLDKIEGFEIGALLGPILTMVSLYIMYYGLSQPEE